MEMFDIAVLLAALAGIIMVVGGIILIYKGAIVLAATDSNSALSIEWKQDFRLNTQAPGLAFFIVGLIFSFVSIYASKPKQIIPITIEGEVAQISEDVTILVRSSTWLLQGGSNGVIKGRVYPHLEDIVLEITAPGYEPEIITYNLKDVKNRAVSFEGVDLEQVVEKIDEEQKNIASAPEKLAPFTAASSYGVPQ